MDLHAHRWTLRQGEQIVSSVDPGGSSHYHEVRGVLSGPPISIGDDHVHTLIMDGVELKSGPSVSKHEAKKDMDDRHTGEGTRRKYNDDSMEKGILPDLVDPDHSYIFKTGEFGLLDFWYVDRANNYWRYTNAPEDHPDYNENYGIPVMDKDQPTPVETPQFFTYEGQKRHMAIPEDLLPDRNESYNAIDPRNIWFEVYERDGLRRYIYLDSDVRENLDLWVQYQLRITDANIPSMRQFAVEKFSKPNVKDRIIAVIIMLLDQGLYELEGLLNATVRDLEFIGDTVKLLGRKFSTDPELFDFLTSLKAGREDSAPLFSVSTLAGEGKLGVRHIASILKYLKISPTYLLAWNASYIYSNAVNRLSLENVSPDEVDGKALSEVKRAFGTQSDLQHLIDTKLRDTLLDNYKQIFSKSMISRVESDEYATLSVVSDLVGRKEREIDFSKWLHNTPLHDVTPEEQNAIQEAAQYQEQLEEEGLVDSEQSEQESGIADQEAGAVDTDFGKEEV